MPKLKRRGMERRDREIPLCDMTDQELAAERDRCEGLRDWHSFGRSIEAHDELDKRFRDRLKTGGPMTGREIERWAGLLGHEADDVWVSWCERHSAGPKNTATEIRPCRG